MTDDSQRIGLSEADVRLLLEILNNLSIKGKDTIYQIMRIILALEQSLPPQEEE